MKARRWFVTGLLGVSLLGAIPAATAFGRDSGPAPQGPLVQAATALGTAFTYQGRLNDAGAPANGTYDLRFILYDAETGGAQVGVTVTKEDIVVTNGLFTTTLDFGASFNGDARWMEIAVRPGTSTGNFTVLSPRQSISPVPYALYAKTAGLALPLAVSATSGTTTSLLDITQAGVGSAIAGRRTISTGTELDAGVLGTNAGAGPGLQGVATGSGAGVLGTSSATAGIGVQGSITGTTGTAGQFIGNGPATAALEINNGALKAAGAARFAFDHVAATTPTSNICNTNSTFIDDTDAVTLTSTSLLFVTPVGATPVAVSVSFGLAIGSCPLDKWVINTPAAVVAGQTFNVLVVRQ